MVRGWRGEVSRRAPGDERSSARSFPFSGPGNGPVFSGGVCGKCAAGGCRRVASCLGVIVRGNTPCARGATLASATARLHSQASRATRRCADRHTSASDTRRDTRRRRHRHT
ncbi:hypothetical protein BURMUCGD2M_1757 [Burkholderia multivorans CGD2M]|uniref:Uncharacterized protein n=1 Tax=Burkholderia multivorans CGD2 TaxID=513052 RepID=B9BXW6_9BURK|nr:hypothetical protein BURMUCGD2_1666 [Burkholderia multivorans CGD2]EEE14597.1 hypothetical protein BURMUCGD2M_1757 [Burkholderia multivorans CGD2M]